MSKVRFIITGSPPRVVVVPPAPMPRWAREFKEQLEDFVRVHLARLADEKPGKWLTIEQTAEHVGISTSTVRRLKAQAEARGVANPPWSYVRRRLVFDATRIDQFIKEAQQWHASGNAGASTTLNGDHAKKGNPARRPSRVSAQRATSSSKSRTASHAASTGSHRRRVMNLASKMSPMRG